MKKIIVVLLVSILTFTTLSLSVAAVSSNVQKNDIAVEEYDKTYYGTIAKAGKIDWYKLTTDSTEAYYYFYLHNETGTDNAHIIVYNDRDVELLDVGYYTGKGQKAEGNVKLDPNTTYYLKVYLNNSGVGNYSIKVSRKIDDAPNTKENAVVVKKEEIQYRSIDGSGDQDWYTITTEAQNEYYYFYLKNESGTSNAHLIVYNDRDVELINVGNYTDAGKEAIGNIKLEPNSKYNILVYFNETGTGNYSFVITSFVDEVGDTKNEAKEIQANKLVSSSIDGAGDMDIFVLKTGSFTSEYKIIYNNETGSTNGHCLIYTARDEKILDVGYYTGAGNSSEGTITLKADTTYYFQVYLNENGTGSYSFTVSQCVDGHTLAEVWETTLEPTCFANGEKCNRCTVCGEVIKTEAIKYLGHDFSNKAVVKEATWLSLGEKKASCSRCGEIEYSKDWSKVWILPLIVVGAIAVLVGIINYVRAFLKSR